MVTPPAVNRRMIEGLLGDLLAKPKDLRLVLVHGRYEGLDTEFVTVVAGTKRKVMVADQHSVLGIVESWQQHQRETAGTDDLLVVTTGVDDSELGWDVRAHAVRNSTQSVETADIVKQRFGAVGIDARIRGEAWLLNGLLEAEPTSGWRRVGGVLTRDTAIAALVSARLGFHGGRDSVVPSLDMAALLAWTCTPGADRFGSVPEAEQNGIASWLGEIIGGAAPVVLSLVARGRAEDVLPLGVLGAAAGHPDSARDAAMALGTLGLRNPAELDSLVRAVEDTLARWIPDHARRQQVREVVRRAEALAAQVGLTEALAVSRFAESGFQARLRAFAQAFTPVSRRDDAIVSAEAALAELRDHALTTVLPERFRVAETALRLRRWLAEPEPPMSSVADGISTHIAELGWVDHGLALLWVGDSTADPIVAKAYGAIYADARARRDRLDEAFAGRLARWVDTADSRAPGGCLLIEDVLAKIVQPLAGSSPLVIVLDGMSSAVAVELGTELSRAGWLEASPEAGSRVAAVATIPSVTMASRASLLCGKTTTGSQPVERAGFSAFWQERGKSAELLHAAGIAGAGGHRLSAGLLEAISTDTVLGVVLNTIDDSLDHGPQGDRTSWRIADITYLPDLLGAARMYGRPVVLVADHGHVLERTPAGTGPSRAEGVESARWRTGTPGDGEIELAGPRVLYGDGRVVVPWREDIRYVKRHNGYHGGAALAEMTVPVLVLLPNVDILPKGWSILSTEMVTPRWWEPHHTAPITAPAAPVARKPKVNRADDRAVPLFQVESGDAATLGARVVATDVYRANKTFVHKAPDGKIIAEVIDLLVAADNRTSLVAVAAKGGRAGRDPEVFATILQRLLNVEGYPVISLEDGDRTLRLNVTLLREQFGVGER